MYESLMENSQFSILTALFGGKAASGAPPSAKTLFDDLSEGADKNAQGFFSFLEGLLKTQPEQENGASNPLGAQPAPGLPAIELARERLKAPSEPVITIGGAEALGAPTAPGATVEGQLSGAAAPAALAVPGEETPEGVQETGSLARTSSAGIDGAHMEAPAGGVVSDAQRSALKAGEDSRANPAPAAPFATASVAAEAAMDPDAQGLAMTADTTRNKIENPAGALLLPNRGVKAPSLPAGAQANAAAALAEQASPQGLEHSALTREQGGVEFDRLASSRFDTVSAAAGDRNLHLHAVRDQVAAAVTARQGDGKLEIRLDPPELGRVTIGFESDGADIVRAVISADTPETLDLMRRHADVFQRALEDQGLEGLDLQFADHGPQENPGEETGDKTYGFGLTEEEAPALLAAAAAPQAALGRLDRRL